MRRSTRPFCVGRPIGEQGGVGGRSGCRRAIGKTPHFEVASHCRCLCAARIGQQSQKQPLVTRMLGCECFLPSFWFAFWSPVWSLSRDWHLIDICSTSGRSQKLCSSQGDASGFSCSRTLTSLVGLKMRSSQERGRILCQDPAFGANIVSQACDLTSAYHIGRSGFGCSSHKSKG